MMLYDEAWGGVGRESQKRPNMMQYLEIVFNAYMTENRRLCRLWRLCASEENYISAENDSRTDGLV